MMRRTLFLIALGYFFVARLAAQDFTKVKQEAFDMSTKGDFSKSLELSQKLYESFPDDIDASILMSYDLINLKRHKEAGPYVTLGLQLDPTNFSIHVDAAYYFAADGNIESARAYLLESIKLYPPGLDLNLVLDEIRQVGQNTGASSRFNELTDWYRRAYNDPANNYRYPTLLGATREFAEVAEKDPSRIKEKARIHARYFDELAWHEMTVAVYAYAALWLRNYGYLSDALEMATAGYQAYSKNGTRNNTYLASFLFYQLVDTYSTLGNDEKAAQYAAEVESLSAKLPYHIQDVNAFNVLAACLDRLGKNGDGRRLAAQSYQLAEQAGYKYGQASAANALMFIFLSNYSEENTNNAIYVGEIALQLAQTYRYENLLGSIMGNLSLAYFRVRSVESQSKGIRLMGSMVALYKQKKMYNDAALSLNNAGAVFFMTKQYDYAANLFEESIKLSEEVEQEIKPEDKLAFYQSQLSAYQFLSACYANMNQPEKAFDVMEGSRSRVLAERLSRNGKIPKTKIAELQRMLAPDEACIMYSLFSGHEIIALVVTRKSSDVLFHVDEDFIGRIKEKYLDRLNKEHKERSGTNFAEKDDGRTRVQMVDLHKVTQLTRKFFETPGLAEEMLDEYLQGYFRFLIQPVLPKLNGIKKLLISPDNVLSLIPFEALKSASDRYLVQDFEVRYMHSAGVLKQLQQRAYPSNRKAVLAMGGAVFQQMNAQPKAINTQQDLNLLELEVAENRKAGRSQRTAYAALFGTRAMNNLPGTVEEVNRIGQLVSPADVFVGADMTENKLKQLSQSGQLGNYKILHLATHGFVVSQLPELSGVAMSIFANEQGGEDGYLNTSEIAALNLKADLTILSACQTALGKIYSGEGVTGLTQSLLVAGSNAALVSLWPVNDTSTMLFMSEFYKGVAQGKPYPQIVTDLKRRFISGEFGESFSHPNYWAPFIYFGR